MGGERERSAAYGAVSWIVANTVVEEMEMEMELVGYGSRKAHGVVGEGIGSAIAQRDGDA